MTLLRVAGAFFLSLLVLACASSQPGNRGTGESRTPSTRPTPSGWTGSVWPAAGSSNDPRYEVGALVAQGKGNAVLCLGAIASPSICFNSPPSAGKVPIANWDWERVEGEELDQDVIYGEYHLIGSYDGTSFTVLEAGPPVPPGESDEDPFYIPCPEPEGGWVAADPSRAKEADLHAAGSYIDSQPDSAGYWIKYLRKETGEASLDFVISPYALVATFRRDIDLHRAKLAAIWGGPLCVVEHSRTEAELSRIQEAVHSDSGAEEFDIEVFGSWTDVLSNRVEIEVVVFDEAAQAIFDSRYGVGAVHQVPSLRPVD